MSYESHFAYLIARVKKPFTASRQPGQRLRKSAGTLAEFLRACERTYITNVLEQNGGRIADSANALGISRKNLWEKMKKLGLEVVSPE